MTIFIRTDARVSVKVFPSFPAKLIFAFKSLDIEGKWKSNICYHIQRALVCSSYEYMHVYFKIA